MVDIGFMKERKKAFVFDTTKGFARFVKISYSKYFNFVGCTNLKHFNAIDFTDVEVAFFLINSDDEILQLMNVYKNVNFVFLSSKIDINMEVYKMEKIIFVNHNQKKKDFILQTTFMLKELNLI